MNVLHLTLKKKWFDMIASGEKLEEYREIKPYWIKRLLVDVETKNPTADYDYLIKDILESGSDDVSYCFQDFDIIRFKNGYAKDAPSMDLESLGINVNEGDKDWGAEPGVKYFVISLGKKLA